MGKTHLVVDQRSKPYLIVGLGGSSRLNDKTGTEFAGYLKNIYKILQSISRLRNCVIPKLILNLLQSIT